MDNCSDATNKSYSITQLYSNEINSNYTTNKAQVSIIGTIKIPPQTLLIQ